MKLFISSDIEGTTGIVCWDETNLQTQVGTYFREQMTREVAAACNGAIDAGCDSIVIKDAHDTARNLIPTGLPSCASLIRGWARDPYCMMTGLDASFDAVFFTGYHSGASYSGNPLSHTMNTDVQEFYINGIVGNEFMINAYTAGYFGVPVCFLSGDQQLCDFAQKFIPNIKTVAVNQGIGGAVRSMNPNAAVDAIQSTAKSALSQDLSLCQVQMPEEFEIGVTFRHHADAYHGGFYPGAQQINAKTVSFSSKDYMDVLKFIMFVL